ncbi:uncharacterized protein ABDE67_002221 [Symphorus nematophorus]
MNQSEDREEGVRPSRTTLCGGHEAQRIHQRPQSDKPGPGPKPEPGPGPGPSCVSFKCDKSFDRLINFKGEEPSAAKRRGCGAVHRTSSVCNLNS